MKCNLRRFHREAVIVLGQGCDPWKKSGFSHSEGVEDAMEKAPPLRGGHA